MKRFLIAPWLKRMLIRGLHSPRTPVHQCYALTSLAHVKIPGSSCCASTLSTLGTAGNNLFISKYLPIDGGDYWYRRNFSNGSGRYSLWMILWQLRPKHFRTHRRHSWERAGGPVGGIKTHGHRGGGRRRAGPDSQASGTSWLELPPVVVLAGSPLTLRGGTFILTRIPAQQRIWRKDTTHLDPVIACTSVLWGLKELSCLWLSVPKERKLTRVKNMVEQAEWAFGWDPRHAGAFVTPCYFLSLLYQQRLLQVDLCNYWTTRSFPRKSYCHSILHPMRNGDFMGWEPDNTWIDNAKEHPCAWKIPGGADYRP